LPHIADYDRELRRRHAQALTNFMTNADMTFRINHKGRLRLWRLREELLTNRQLEDHGILLRQQYRDRDFEIAWLFQEQGKPVSVLYSDLDNFKAVNTKLGHGPGDEVMKTYLGVIRDEVNGIGEAYRGVGDEVTVILPNLGKEPAEKIAQAIRLKVEEQCKALAVLTGHKPLPTVSIGGATFAKPIAPDVAFAFVDRLLMDEAKVKKGVVIFKEYPAA
jgi:diguanylate cyclase (GGDEF)-like protein